MDKFCEKCGAELLDNGVCPNCGDIPDEPKPEEAAPETIEEEKEKAAPEQSAEPEQNEAQNAASQPLPETQPEAEQTTPQPEVQKVQPSKFYYAFKQVGNVLKHFFSKNTIDAISAQYNEALPIWVIFV